MAGILHVTGDGAANRIHLTGLGNQQALLSPLDDTTINGSHAPVAFAGINIAYDIQLGDGDDFLYVSNTDGPAGLFIDMGNGNDGLAIDYARHRGVTSINTGAGDDLVSIGVGRLDGFTALDVGPGNNHVDIAGVRFGSMAFVGGSGLDTLGLLDVNFRQAPVMMGFDRVYSSLAPVAYGDLAVVAHGTTAAINVAANDIAAQGALDPASVQITEGPQHGSVSVNGDGTVSYTADRSSAVSDSFKYTIRNSLGAWSNEGLVTLVLTPVHTVPDTTGPTATITTTATNPTNLASIPFTVTFSESVTGFTSSDVHVTNGTVSGFAGSGKTFTFNVAPTANGTVGVSLAAGAAKDAAGNNSKAASKTITSDRTAPTAAITTTSNPANPNAIPVKVTFSESVTGFTLSDVTVTGASASGLAGSGTTYTFTVTPTPGATQVQIDVAAGVAFDAAGNGNTAAPEFTTNADRTSTGMVSTVPDVNDTHWQTMPDNLKVWDIQTGTGPAVTSASQLGVFYTGWLTDGTVFDSALTAGSPAMFPLAGLIDGWKEGLIGMQPGGIRRLFVPFQLGYGTSPHGSIPGSSNLIFEIKLVSVA